jgi:hypothetical protein
MILCNCGLIQIEMEMKPWLKVSRLVAPMPSLERDLKGHNFLHGMGGMQRI